MAIERATFVAYAPQRAHRSRHPTAVEGDTVSEADPADVVRRHYEHAGADDLLGIDPADCYGATLATTGSASVLWTFIRRVDRG